MNVETLQDLRRVVLYRAESLPDNTAEMRQIKCLNNSIKQLIDLLTEGEYMELMLEHYLKTCSTDELFELGGKIDIECRERRPGNLRSLAENMEYEKMVCPEIGRS